MPVERELRGRERAVRHGRERGTGPIADRRERVERTDLGEDDAFVALEVRVRTGSAEGGDRRVDEARIVRRQRVVVETESARSPRAKRVDDHVAGEREVARHVVVGRITQVELDALRSPIPEGKGGLRPKRAPTRGLDVHHVGAEVGEELGHVRSRQRVRQRDDAQTLQRPAHGRTPNAGRQNRNTLVRTASRSTPRFPPTHDSRKLATIALMIARVGLGYGTRKGAVGGAFLEDRGQRLADFLQDLGGAVRKDVREAMTLALEQRGPRRP